MPIDMGDHLSVEARMSLHGSIVMNVFTVAVGFVDSDLDSEVKDDMLDWLSQGYSELIGIQSTDLVYTDVRVVNLTQDYLVGQDTWLTVETGTSGSDSLASQDAGLVSFPCPNLGHRGRKYIPGIAEDYTNDSVFTSTAIDALGEFGFKMFGAFEGFASGTDYTPVNRNPTGTPGVYVYRPFIGWSVSSVVARMGSRKKGVGI